MPSNLSAARLARSLLFARDFGSPFHLNKDKERIRSIGGIDLDSTRTSGQQMLASVMAKERFSIVGWNSNAMRTSEIYDVVPSG